MRFSAFSPKQLEALTWWCPASASHRRDAVICDGAVRSGKTLCLSLSFALWAMTGFAGQNFALCGKTVTSLRRNLVTPLIGLLEELGFTCRHKISQSVLEIGWQGRENRFYLFGGRDEGSAALIQGVTLAGILMDEVALMPRSFVEQGLARCSVEGSRFWFNCNPDHPSHWFYTEWIQNAAAKSAHYIHFTMADNPSLTPAIRERYERLYTGVFHERYVLGRWVAAHGAVYPMFDPAIHVVDQLPVCSRCVISCDYGTVNPASFGLWGERDGVWYRLAEYYHSSRATGRLLTDEEYADALERLAAQAPCPVEKVIVDPSAASFIQCLRRRGRLPVVQARNGVVDGIRVVAAALKAGRLRFHRGCKDIQREFHLYRWDMNAPDDLPIKENDHAMDDLRYFATEMLAGDDPGFFAGAVCRRQGFF